MNSDITDRTGELHGTVGKKTRQRSVKRVALIGLGVVLLLAIARYADHWWTVGRFVMTTDDAYVGGNVTPLAAHVSGFVAAIPVGDNDYVRRGQVVLRLDANDLAAAEARADALVQQRRAAVASLQARYVAQRAVIAEAQAVLAAKRATAAFAATTAARYRRLAGGEAASRQDIRRSVAATATATAAVRAAAAELVAARQQRAVLATDITAARATVVAAAADLRMATIARSYATITAPIDGYIADRYARRGAFVTAGTTLLSIVPAHGLWVDANFKEDDLARIKPGDPATIVADELPGRVFHGHVVSLAPATGAIFSVIPPQNATGNFTKIVQRVPVRIALEGDARRLGSLRPGLSTTVSVDTKSGPVTNR
ncbi:MAG: HlyD family secretion protein [Proteobacteria bacterium]|nr:HlyD family secretion protein [Pseudomonadota bacterium]